MKKQRIFLIFFCIILALPLIFSNKVGGEISPDENRYLARFPELTLHSGIKSDIENWINDNAGGRRELRSLYNNININFFKTPRADGRFYQDDWVFLAHDSALTSYFLQENVLSSEEQNQFIEDYRACQRYLKYQSTEMCSVIFPYKAEMYTEKFKKYLDPMSDTNQLTVLTNIAINNSDLNLNVTYDIFKKEKEGGKQLYSKAYDASHWNNQGAWIGYQELMKTVQNVFPDISILTEENMNISEIQRSAIYNEKEYSETDLEYQVKIPMSSENPSWFQYIGFESSDMWKSYRYYSNANQELPKILIIGDSYVWMFMLPWISESFSETVFIHQLDVGNYDLIASALHPDIVVFAGIHDGVIPSISTFAAQIP